jgi:microcystin-dependent protein
MPRGIFQYAQDLINDSSKSINTTYSSNRIEELLGNMQLTFHKTTNVLTEKVIGNVQTINIADITTNISDLKIGHIIFDTSEILGRIISIDNTVNQVDVEILHANLSSGGCIEIKGCLDTAPTVFNAGDKYFNTTTSLLYTANASGWDTGSAPESETLYINTDNNKLYAYVNGIFDVYGGNDYQISTKVDNALKEITGSAISSEDGLYVKDLELELAKLNWAQKTVNEVGEFELLDAPTTFNLKNATTSGNAIITTIHQDIILKDDITNYDSIEIYFAPITTLASGVPQSTQCRVNQIVYNNSNTAIGNNGSILTITFDSNTTSVSGFGLYHISLQGWFKDTKTLHILQGVNSSGQGFDKMSLVSIVGKKTKSIIIDPVEYVNTTQGIEDTPVGHIMATMSNNAPLHYLMCDGSIYNIVDYPYLAEHFKTEFGSYNHFGGDGTTTFAVPDLRGEFLRGTGANSHANQGSGGAIGEHQDGTSSPLILSNTNKRIYFRGYATTTDYDYKTGAKSTSMMTPEGALSGTETQEAAYTSRPTNTSVLYCIKYEPTYFMNIGDITYEYGCEKILGCFDTPPASFIIGDKYFNTIDNLIYEADTSTTWGVGQNPNTDVIYLNLDNKKIYNFNNGVFEVFGGSSSTSSATISKQPNNAIEQKADGIYVYDYASMIAKIQDKRFSGLDKGYYFITGKMSDTTKTWNAGYSLISFIKNSLGTGNYIENSDLAVSTNGYISLTEGAWSLSAGTVNESTNAIKYVWKDSDGNVLGNQGFVPSGTDGNTNIDANALVTVNKGEVLNVAPIRLDTNGAIEQLYSFVSIQRVGTTDVDPVAYLSKDGNLEETPVGSIISYMGNNVPKHYLACDGTVYNIVDYPELALHIKNEFGSYNYFDGDGINTFAVPNLSGEFLRGTGANSRTNQGSGANVGEHQDATEFPNLYVYDGTFQYLFPEDSTKGNNLVTSPDTMFGTRKSSRYTTTGTSDEDDYPDCLRYTTRPTNTSVLYCIKYETTHKIFFGDQTTYKVSVPVTYNFPQTAQMVWAEFDTANAEDDISMLGSSLITSQGDAFVAPMDGYYHATFMFPEQADIPGTKVTYHCTYIYKNGDVIGGSDRQDNSTNIRVPLNESFTLKLKKGDTINVGMYMGGQTGAFTRNGQATFCLVNTLNENKTAELMNKPNTWVVGQEYDFGDGIYGQRFTGSKTASSNVDTDVSISLGNMSAPKLIEMGGYWQPTSTLVSGFQQFNMNTYIGSAFSGGWLSSDGSTGALTLRFNRYDPGIKSLYYDVWILYTKQ